MGGSSGSRRGWLPAARRRWTIAGLLCAALPVLADTGPSDPTVLALGPTAQQQATTSGPRLSLVTNAPFAPGVGGQEIGLQWSQPFGARQSIDITAWRRSEPVDAMSLIRQRDPVLGARLEIRLSPARRGLITDYRFLGIQLDNGARIGLRRKDGNPAITYRQTF